MSITTPDFDKCALASSQSIYEKTLGAVFSDRCSIADIQRKRIRCLATFQLHAPPQRPAADLTQRSPCMSRPPIEVLDIFAADERVAAIGR
ncbi:hypothetical protein [Pseudomonas aeruginosa]|uniref:hypothetical protein n=1 Tax=Pseudomonas aeruginosa TaxID=287 RepID=UPI000F52015D|nr:hypothetical protein [Pseudomonas aeruginosa]